MNWGIIGALKQEVERIIGQMENVERTSHYSSAYYTGTLRGQSVIVAECGIGKINAALCTHILIQYYHADCIINTGVAGGMSADLKTADIVISDEVVFHDVDDVFMTEYYPHRYRFTADRGLIDLASQAAQKEARAAVHVGRIATGDLFVNDPALKESIGNKVAPLCVEMEGAAVGQVCFMNSTPFVVIRSISDDAGESAALSFEEFLGQAARISANVTVNMITSQLGQVLESRFR